jgi:hypothetical protein
MKTAYNRILHNKFVGVMLALTVLGPLGACGDSTATNIPVQTTAAVAGATTSAAQTPAAGSASVAPGNPAQARLNAPLSGTVESYDATSKVLTVKAADGTSQKFDASTARITKADKISLTDLGQLVTNNEVVQVMGAQGTDGTYTATQLTVLDSASAAAGGQGGNGFPGGGRGPGFANGTPVAGGTPGAGGRGPGFANGTPGAAGGQPGFGGQRGGLVLRNASLSGTTLTGTDFSGASVTVNLTATTPITKRVAGAVTDLTNGLAVNVTYRADQNSGTNSAILITINE